MTTGIGTAAPALLICLSVALTGAGCIRDRSSEDDIKTTFQTSSAWRPTIDNRADAVMVYGVGGNPSDKENPGSVEQRLKSWKDRGYETHFMTGIAWGGYQDYFTGKWDGMPHLDEGQVQADGDTIWHGRMVPYIVPTRNYLDYFKERQIKRVIDAGVDVIFLEEPEFWARAGYSESFKKEWEDYYHSPWQPQDSSPEATYLSNKLKYHLYYRALEEAFTFAKEYGHSKGMDIKCHVPTHSLINYSKWQIVSPEASLASLPCVDGYIAQVWTGTSRSPEYFNGVLKERIFENAFLEYGCMKSMTGPTGRKLWFLTDPIEDRAVDWEDYRSGYHATFSAQLLYPSVASFEIMPWPERIYERLYRKSAGSDEMIRIPGDYSTMMQVMVNALHDIPATEGRASGSGGIGILMGNSLMFQNFPVHEGYDDPAMSNFYGLAMPLLKRGVPVEIVHIENLGHTDALKDIKVLLMSYSNMKPLDPSAHEKLRDWVGKGGRLVYCGTDDDPFQSVPEWWNSDGNGFKAPSDHLFGLMGMQAGTVEGKYTFGKGRVTVLRTEPKEYVMTEGGDEGLVRVVKDLYPGQGLTFKNSFRVDRGPYTVVAVMDESVSDDPYVLEGRWIDLFDSTLPVVEDPVIEPGHQGFFYDLSKTGRGKPKVLASASRIYDEKARKGSYSFTAMSPSGTVNVSRIHLPAKPAEVLLDGKDATRTVSWDETSRTCLLVFDNSPDGVNVTIKW